MKEPAESVHDGEGKGSEKPPERAIAVRPPLCARAPPPSSMGLGGGGGEGRRVRLNGRAGRTLFAVMNRLFTYGWMVHGRGHGPHKDQPWAEHAQPPLLFLGRLWVQMMHVRVCVCLCVCVHDMIEGVIMSRPSVFE